ncbi:MAG: phosphoribosylformylglycinamidine synthase subunit PurS [Acidobacteriota bacterium]|nr:phosphoribosylformylglycinamidine synthase subunit PurS [Acidobacteriota bacterium]
MRARVLIRPKAGILDPQGKAVERALPALGFHGVQNVHVGRLIELDVPDGGELQAMCERLLANPLVEEFEIQAVEAADASSPADGGCAGRAPHDPREGRAMRARPR